MPAPTDVNDSYKVKWRGKDMRDALFHLKHVTYFLDDADIAAVLELGPFVSQEWPIPQTCGHPLLQQQSAYNDTQHPSTVKGSLSPCTLGF